MKSIDFEKLLFSQKKVVKLLASNQQLEVCLDAICLEIESLIGKPGITASILKVYDNKLHFAAGPNINSEYSEAIEGVVVADNVGSCGTAAFNAQPFYAEDISTSPQWADFSELAKKYNFCRVLVYAYLIFNQSCYWDLWCIFR